MPVLHIVSGNIIPNSFLIFLITPIVSQYQKLSKMSPEKMKIMNIQSQSNSTIGPLACTQMMRVQSLTYT